ncbi:MAG: hypothetical protein COA96_15390 [SAR86 cluster bacterium]|uniref:Peptidase S12 Pab87-related C-terminal domain-containing protein n=1 Tax=SAR86 cluster bacterium TaxID=2030880 RepID=A0A2A5AP09_9GAMM|nr:MAG: hypothetical protein COA96_15390 [SAR86 cluster bacterium]
MNSKTQWIRLPMESITLIGSILLLFVSINAYPQTHQQNYDVYTGDYEITPSFVLTITHDEGSLYVQATGQKKFQLNSLAEHEFIYAEREQRIKFNFAESGEVDSITQWIDRFVRNAPKTTVSLLESQENELPELDAAVGETLEFTGKYLETLGGGSGGSGPLGGAIMVAARNELGSIRVWMIVVASSEYVEEIQLRLANDSIRKGFPSSEWVELSEGSQNAVLENGSDVEIVGDQAYCIASNKYPGEQLCVMENAYHISIGY